MSKQVDRLSAIVSRRRGSSGGYDISLALHAARDLRPGHGAGLDRCRGMDGAYRVYVFVDTSTLIPFLASTELEQDGRPYSPH